jgi:hypothetical protein
MTLLFFMAIAAAVALAILAIHDYLAWRKLHF